MENRVVSIICFDYFRCAGFWIAFAIVLVIVIILFFASIITSPIYCTCGKRFEHDEIDEYVDHLSGCPCRGVGTAEKEISGGLVRDPAGHEISV